VSESFRRRGGAARVRVNPAARRSVPESKIQVIGRGACPSHSGGAARVRVNPAARRSVPESKIQVIGRGACPSHSGSAARVRVNPAARPGKNKKPHQVQAVRRERVKNVQVLIGAWTYVSLVVTGYASHYNTRSWDG